MACADDGADPGDAGPTAANARIDLLHGFGSDGTDVWVTVQAY